MAFEGGDLVLGVEPRWRRPRCGGCEKRAPGYDHRPARRWRQLGLGRLRIWLAYAPRRVRCRRCGAYVRERLTNGIVEGINNKLRMIARRAYGFHSPPPLIAMLYLCCGGIRLDPPLPKPT